MARKGSPDEVQQLLDSLRRMYAQQMVLMEAGTELEVKRQEHDNDRRALAARIEKVWALVRAQLESSATGQPMPEVVDLVGTPCVVACPNCNGIGCGHCDGHGVVQDKRPGRALDVQP